MKNLISAFGAIALAVMLVTSTAVLADPPAHAKAHGWRKKHDPSYVGYTGREWERDYGIIDGTCNRKEIGTVLGAVVGGAIGSQIGDGSGRTVAIIAGTILGAVVGREIGRDLDDGDRACIGHALEIGRDGQEVRWMNEATGVSYVVTPLARAKTGESCRTYKLTAVHGKKTSTSDQRACRAGDGTWKMS